MVYFKHSELVNDYHVSLKTVHNWIDAAKQGKLDLQLHELNGRTYISNTPKNLIILSSLVDKGKKYRNTLHHKSVSPKAEFYDLYNKRQILDIISNLDVHHEVPRQYNYFDGGANNWDNYTLRLLGEDSSNLSKDTISLVRDNQEAVDKFLEGRQRINVIDVGPGNAWPVKDLIGHLLEKGVLHRYIAVDISQSMLDIAERNINDWFGGEVRFEGHLRDISYERFDDLLVDDILKPDSERVANLVLMLGGTIANFRKPVDVLKVLYGSMDSDDLFMYTSKPDTKQSRRFFDFNHQRDGAAGALSPNHSFILDLMNIDRSAYDVEMGFDDQEHMRYIRVRFKTALTVKFKFENNERSVSFEKGETILLLRFWHKTLLEHALQFEEVGFTLLHSSLTKERECLLTVLGVDKSLPNKSR